MWEERILGNVVELLRRWEIEGLTEHGVWTEEILQTSIKQRWPLKETFPFTSILKRI